MSQRPLRIESQDEKDLRMPREHQQELSQSGQEPHETISQTAKKLDRILADVERVKEIQHNSVYGVVLAVPQIARSVGWTKSMVILAIRSVFFYVLNLGVQFFLVYFMYSEIHHIDEYAAKPSLCNFGANTYWSGCPGSPDCVGPGGTIMTPSSFYSYDAWSTRTFMRDTLLNLFPERADEISEHVQPGEYGVESYWCRLLCCFVFCSFVMEDFYRTADMLLLLEYVPTDEGNWVIDESEGDSTAEEPEISFALAGIPLRWKIFNFFVLALPQLALWKAVTFIGVTFLMNTAAITDMIVNTTALAFLLNIDELFYVCLMSKSTRHMMENLKPADIEKAKSVDGTQYSHKAVSGDQSTSIAAITARDLLRLIPWRMILNFIFTFLFVVEYYWNNCILTDTGSWVSEPKYVPPTLYYSPWCVFIHCDEGTHTIWTMRNATSQ